MGFIGPIKFDMGENFERDDSAWLCLIQSFLENIQGKCVLEIFLLEIYPLIST